MNNLKFESDEVVKIISLDDLKQTLTSESLTGRVKRNAPISHYDFIESVQESLDKKNLKLVKDDIIISKQGLKRIPQLDPDNVYLLSSILIQNLVSSFHIEDFQNNEMNLKIGLGYNQNGLTLAFGSNIKVCSNMTIMGAEHLITTGGSNGVNYTQFNELLDHRINQLENSWNYYDKTINMLKDRTVNNASLFEMVGRLSKLAVEEAYYSGKNSPFNISENSAFIKEMLGNGTFEQEKSEHNYWDLFNIGTNILTHSKNNVANKWEVSHSFGNFMADFITTLN